MAGDAVAFAGAGVGVVLSVPVIAVTMFLLGGRYGRAWLWRALFIASVVTYAVGVWRMGNIISGHG